MTVGRRLLVVSSSCRGEPRELHAVPAAAAKLYATMADPERGQCTPVLLDGVELDGPLDNPDVDRAKEALRQAVQQCSDSEELLVLAWIGHGSSEENNNTFYVMPRGTNDDHPSTTGLDLVDWLRRVISDWGARIPGLVLLLDACYSGAAVTSAARTLIAELDPRIAVEVLTSTTKDLQAYDARFTNEIARLIHEGLPAHGGDYLLAADLKPLLMRATKQYPQSMSFDVRYDGAPVWIAKNIGKRRMARAARLAALAESAADAGRYDRAVRLALIACRETGESHVHPSAQSALYRSCDGNRLVHQFGPASRVLFNRSGTRLVSLHGITAQLWDPASGTACGTAMLHDDEVRDAAFSADGARLVTCTYDHVHTWDTDTGTAVSKPLRIEGQYFGRIESVTVLDEGGIRCVFVDMDGRLPMVVDIGASLHRCALEGADSPFPHYDCVGAAAATQDGRLVATGSLDGSVSIWKRKDAHAFELARDPIKHGGWISSVAFSLDGRRLLVASMNGVAAIWDTEPHPITRAFGPERPVLLPHVERVYEAHDKLRGVHQATFSPGGNEAITASADGTARLWGAGGLVATAGEIINHDKSVQSACLAPPNADRIATTTSDDVARIWKRTLPRRRWNIDGRIVGKPIATFSPNGRRMLVQLDDKSVVVRSVVTGELEGRLMTHADAVIWGEFSVDGRYVVTTSNLTAHLWDSMTGAPVGEPMSHASFAPFPDPRPQVLHRARVSPDASLLVSVDTAGTVCLWDLAKREPRVLAGAGFRKMRDALFSPDCARLLMLDAPAILWELAPVRECKSLDHATAKNADPDKARVYCAAFSPDGQRVVTGALDGSLRLWDAKTGKAVGQPMVHGSVRCQSVDFSPDGKRFVSASCDGTARLWSVPACKPIGQPITHGDVLHSARFSRDGKRVVTASNDCTAGIWHGITGARLAEAIRHDDAVEIASFNPTEDTILTATDHCVAVWEAPFSVIESTVDLARAACAALPEAARCIDAVDVALASEFIPQESVGQDVSSWRPAEL